MKQHQPFPPPPFPPQQATSTTAADAADVANASRGECKDILFILSLGMINKIPDGIFLRKKFERKRGTTETTAMAATSSAATFSSRP